jgi:hypothetical protein
VVLQHLTGGSTVGRSPFKKNKKRKKKDTDRRCCRCRYGTEKSPKDACEETGEEGSGEGGDGEPVFVDYHRLFLCLLVVAIAGARASVAR